MSRRNKHWLAWTGLIVTAVGTYLAVRNASVDEVWKALRESSYAWLAPACAAYAASIFLRALRWRYLFVAEARPALGPTTRALVLGYFLNNVLPVRAGDGARILALKRFAGTSHAETAGTVVLERVYDVLALLILLLVALPWLPGITWLAPALWLGGAVVAGLAVSAVVLSRYGHRPLGFVLRPLHRLRISPERIELGAAKLTHGLAGVTRPRVAAAALMWTLVAWVPMALSFWLVTLCFDFDLSPASGLLVLVATGLSMILPSAPAAVGVFEAAAVVALGAYGVSESEALSYAVVLHAMTIVLHVGAGVVVLRTFVPFRGAAWARQAAGG